MTQKTNHPSGSEYSWYIVEILFTFKIGRNLKLLESNLVLRILFFSWRNQILSAPKTNHWWLNVNCSWVFSCDFFPSDIGVEMAPGKSEPSLLFSRLEALLLRRGRNSAGKRDTPNRAPVEQRKQNPYRKCGFIRKGKATYWLSKKPRMVTFQGVTC